MNPQIKPNSIWKAVRNPGRGLVHVIQWIDPEDGWIYTWSQMLEDPAVGGFAWSGPEERFLRDFVPIPGVTVQ